MVTKYINDNRLGAFKVENGANFAIFSKNATAVTLNIFKNSMDNDPEIRYKLNAKHNKTGDIWHICIEDEREYYFYTWNIEGHDSSHKGHHFNGNDHILDPYAKVYTEKNERTFEKSVLFDEEFLNREIKRPKIRPENRIIYELHVSLFTKNGNSYVKFPGTYVGLIEKIKYLKSLGVTTVELLPVYEFDDFSTGINPETGEKLKNVWGYNPIGFSAISTKYVLRNSEGKFQYDAPLKEFSKMVDEFHNVGMEVILDVVYNHTAEGNEKGVVYNFKGQDNSIFYILENDKKFYTNYSGCGNTLNCNHPVVKKMIIDSLRYWYGTVGVDGFRFDLATILGRDESGQWIESGHSILKDISEDIVLSRAKLIAEPWDAGGGYHINGFPKQFMVWNGKYRDCIRKFIKGEHGTIQELTQRITGSSDVIKGEGKGPFNSVNFITAHDGFTMWDLVSYDYKNNLINGEQNRDGDNNNHSWNHGFEGETDSEKINNLRIRQTKNMMLMLMISQGTPMVLMGDEMGRTQRGNNNAYCQDSELTWIDWKRGEKFSEIREFLKNIIRFRKQNRGFKVKNCSRCNSKIKFHGVKPGLPDFTYYSHTLAVTFEQNHSQPIYVAFNSYHEPLEFQLPIFEGKKWYIIADTFRTGKDSWLESEELITGKYITIPERTSIIAIAK